MSHPPSSPSSQAAAARRAPRSPARGPFSTVCDLGTGLVALGAALVVLLHVIPPSNRVNPWTRTISEYALGGNGWIFDIAVFALALGSVAVLAGLVGGRVVSAVSGTSVFFGFWSAGLVTLVVFEKYDFAHGITTGSSGMIHRMASLVAFLSLPLAALLTLRSARRDPGQRFLDPSWRRSARWTRWAAAASCACLSLLAYAIVRRILTGTPWWRVFPIGGLERLIASAEILTLFALGSWARLANRRERPVAPDPRSRDASQTSSAPLDDVGDGAGGPALV